MSPAAPLPAAPLPAADLPFGEFAARLKRLEAFRERSGLDAVLLLTEEGAAHAIANLYYFTGLVCDNGALLLERGRPPAFRTDPRYLVMARRKAPALDNAPIWPASREQDALAAKGRGWRRIGYEGSISARRFLALRDALPAAEWVDVSRTLGEMRSVKSPAEQDAMRRAAARNDELLASLLRRAAPGATEWALRAFARAETDRLGQGEAFDTIVCFGENAAECHHVPDASVLRDGRPMLVDLGIRLDHYCSDMTRCAFFGKPTALYREIHRIVHDANRAAIRAIRPGLPCGEIDAVARGLIERAGYGEAFCHSLGHGVGLEIHESPGFHPGCETILEPGMVITVEPGIYLPGELGIRLEDLVLVTETGCEILSQTPHDL